MDLAILQKEALQLSETDRALLADQLLSSLDSIPEEISSTWVQESRDRVTAYRAGEIEAVDGPSAMDALRDRFSK
ncbi:MAG: hypothetical protein CMO55_20900 [Verrucomicrobiales bacterium]|nr:hypothetical protein [Verrucomicrobiales bacterium]